MKVAIVGIGRVGLPLAAVSAKHYDTLGIDVNPRVVEKVNKNEGFDEPSVQDYLKRYELRASTDFEELKSRDLVLLCVGSQTPGVGYSARNLISALQRVCPYLQSRTQSLGLITTTPPQAVKEEILPFLQRQGVEKRISGVCYNPTMIALGDAIRGFENPNYLMIGASTPKSGDMVESFWRGIISNHIPIFRSSILNIAIAKYALNTALTLKITLMNTMTELAESLGGDIDVLAEILKSDPRIAGTKMFKGGLGYGGTCYPVDVEALRAECEKLGLPATLPDAIHSVNDRQVDRSVSLIESYGKKRISILGATYRPNTSVVVASQALQIASRLAKDGFEIMVYDPMGIEGARAELGRNALYSTDLDKALSFGNVVFLAVEWPEFTKLGRESFHKEQVVIDPWRILRSKALDCTYVGYGLGR